MIEYKLDIYPEECCEECSEILHNHFNCPICKHPYASTNIYEELYNVYSGVELTCQECNAAFECIDKNPDYYNGATWRHTNASID